MALTESPSVRHTYKLAVEPLKGKVVARRGGQVLAASERARIMFETRLSPVVYFPREDVMGLTGKKSDLRTFCPFKGTAVYEGIDVDGERQENAVWYYPRTLPESRLVEGYVAFMPGIVDHLDMPESTISKRDDGHIASPIVDWLLREAHQISDPAELTREIALQFRKAGIAVDLLNASIWPRHPEIAGYSYRWDEESGEVTTTEQLHEALMGEEYMRSSTRFVREGLGGVRQPLDGRELEFDFPLLGELIEKGATDFVAMPLFFADGRINVMTMATSHPDGFTTSNLGLVFECSSVIGRFYEVQVQRLDTQSLLETYLGQRTGGRVLNGEIRRGDGDQIKAAILFCDLRNSSRLSNTLDRHGYLTLLNQFFETVSDEVIRHDGEVLKFVGDAVLAVFQHSGDLVCASADAIQAAKGIAQSLKLFEEEGIDCAIGISSGEVTYGNVGARDRLDFTVTGHAANLAARLSERCKQTGVQILLDEKTANNIGEEVAECDRFTPRNFDQEIRVFSPAES